jgi:predicted transcriptional regulator
MKNLDHTVPLLENCSHFEKMVIINALDITGVDKQHFYESRRFPIVVRTRALIANALRAHHYTFRHIAKVLNITTEMAQNYCKVNHNEYLENTPEYEGMYNRLIQSIQQVHSADTNIESRLSDVEVEMNRMKQRVDHLSKLVVE